MPRVRPRRIKVVVPPRRIRRLVPMIHLPGGIHHHRMPVDPDYRRRRRDRDGMRRVARVGAHVRVRVCVCVVVPVHGGMIDRRPGRAAGGGDAAVDHAAAAAPRAGVPAVAMGVVPGAGRRVPARDYVSHVEPAPGKAGEIGAVVFEGQVFRVGDVVG